jgi:hypothetical protein
MIRKYGYDEIERYVPEDDKKLVSSIRKRQARSKKKKLAQMEVEEEGDEDEVRISVSPRFFDSFRLADLFSRSSCRLRRNLKPLLVRHTTKYCTDPTRTSRSTRMLLETPLSRHLPASRTARRWRGRTRRRPRERTFRKTRTRCSISSTIE